jgi:hypothetical protein
MSLKIRTTRITIISVFVRKRSPAIGATFLFDDQPGYQRSFTGLLNAYW